MSVTIDLENKKLKFTDNVIDVFNKYKQINHGDLEAGGILIGRENIGTGNIIVEFITEPLDKDKRKKYSFKRNDKKHIEIYNKLYNEHNGIYCYIGEWHTHPEDYPNYSCIDIKNWIRIAKNNDDKSKVYYHLIVGNKEIRVWRYTLDDGKIAKRVY